MSAYGPLCQQFYDADKPRPDDAELAWYLDRLPRDAGPVLEPMCGSGRLLLPLAERGFAMHGVDTSAAMLAACASWLLGPTMKLSKRYFGFRPLVGRGASGRGRCDGRGGCGEGDFVSVLVINFSSSSKRTESAGRSE